MYRTDGCPNRNNRIISEIFPMGMGMVEVLANRTGISSVMVQLLPKPIPEPNQNNKITKLPVIYERSCMYVSRVHRSQLEPHIPSLSLSLVSLPSLPFSLVFHLTLLPLSLFSDLDTHFLHSTAKRRVAPSLHGD